MPLGINRTDLNDTTHTFKDGDPVTTPIDFGTEINDVDVTYDFGNQIPTSGTEQNDVEWEPSPDHFGNTFTPPPN